MCNRLMMTDDKHFTLCAYIKTMIKKISYDKSDSLKATETLLKIQ